ncbi:hypothetical protein SLA2020_016110 [Shorea laevis]
MKRQVVEPCLGGSKSQGTLGKRAYSGDSVTEFPERRQGFCPNKIVQRQMLEDGFNDQDGQLGGSPHVWRSKLRQRV